MLAQGCHGSNITGTNPLFILNRKCLTITQVTFSQIVYDLKPDKDKKHRRRLTVGRNRILCNYDISTPTAELTTVKLLLNSVIPTSNVKFMTIDINHLYLNTDIPNH